MILPTCLQLGLWMLFWVQFFSKVMALKGDSGCNFFLCLNATLSENGEEITYELTDMYQPLGWLALGWGKKMDGTHMIIAWPNDDGTVTLSQRYGVGHHEPALMMDPPRPATVVDPVPSSWHPPNSTRMAFKLPVDKEAMKKDPVERLIWAYGMTRPQNHDNAHLLPHYSAGFLKINFTKEAVPPPPPLPGQQEPIATHPPEQHHDQGETMPSDTNSDGDKSDVFGGAVITASGPWGNHEKLIVAHGVLLSLGFLVLLPAGSLIARWTRTITPRWFKAHSVINMSIGLPLIVIGWLLGPMAVIDHQGAHLLTTHQICGVFLLALYLLQIWLGRYIHRRRAEGLVPVNRAHPPSNVLHVILGLSVIIFAFFQVRSGLDEWEYATGRGPLGGWCHDLWLAWIVIIPFAYLAGLSLIPRQFHQERQHILPGTSANYISLGDGTESPLLQESAGIYEESGGQFKNTRVSMESVKMVSEVDSEAIRR